MQGYTLNLYPFTKYFYTGFQRKLVKTSSNNFDTVGKFQANLVEVQTFQKKDWLLISFVETEDGVGDKIYVCSLKKRLHSDFSHISAYWIILTTPVTRPVKILSFCTAVLDVGVQILAAVGLKGLSWWGQFRGCLMRDTAHSNGPTTWHSWTLHPR